MLKTASKEARHRTRNAVATRAAILASAKSKFAADSYENVGLREIAHDADVNVALIARYFGSKARLFEEVVRELMNPRELISGNRSTFGKRMAQAFVTGERGPHLQALFVVVRAAGSPSAQPILEDICHEAFMVPFAKWLGGRDAELRANLISSTLFGAILSVATEKKIRLSGTIRKAYMRKLAVWLQAWVDGREPADLPGHQRLDGVK